jgi:hypothetical protein
MAKAVLELDLSLRVPVGEEGPAAAALLAQLPPAARAAFVALAAAVVTLAEAEAGSTVLVVPKGFAGRVQTD